MKNPFRVPPPPTQEEYNADPEAARRMMEYGSRVMMRHVRVGALLGSLGVCIVCCGSWTQSGSAVFD